MSIIDALILGLLQGATEFIPVSSSGHLLLAHEILGTGKDLLSFDVMLHVGTLLALLIYFYKDILVLAKNLFNKNKEGKLARLLLLATLPAALAGLLFSSYIEDNLRTTSVVVVTLSLVALLMIYADNKSNSKDKEITKDRALKVGFAQALALIPGVSRSGITITTGVLTGMDKKAAARFSFLLAIPIIAGSAVGILIKDFSFSEISSTALAVGFVASFLSGLVAIKFLLNVIAKVGLKPFAYYRLALAVLVLIFIV